MVIIFLDIVGKADSSVMWSLLKQLFCIFPQAMRIHCQDKGTGKKDLLLFWVGGFCPLEWAGTGVGVLETY